MATSNIIQSSLVSGILSNTAYGRIDILKYYNGVAEATNMIVESQGGLKKRVGFEFISLMDDYRMFEFLFNTNDKAVIFIGNDIKIWNITSTKFDTFNGKEDDAVLYTLKQSKELDFVQSGDTMIITHQDVQPQMLVRDRTDQNNVTWKLKVLPLTNIPQYNWDENKHESGASRVLKADVEWDEGKITKIRDDITAAINVGQSMLPRVRTYIQELNSTFANLAQLYTRDETIRDIYRYPAGFNNGVIYRTEWIDETTVPTGYIGKENPNGLGYDYLPGDKTFRLSDNLEDVEDPNKFYIIPKTIETGENQQRWATQVNRISVDYNNVPLGWPWYIHSNNSFNTVWDETLVDVINEAVRNTITLKDADYNLMTPDQLENLMGEDYSDDVNAAIKAVIGNFEDVTDPNYAGYIDNVWGPTTTRVNQPDETKGVNHGYPAYCTFYQNRLVLAGSTDKPMSIWSSVVNDLYNFDISEPDDDYALADTLNSNTLNHITGLYAGKVLQVYTSGAEYINDSKPMTPAQSNWEFQTGMGSPDNVSLDSLDGSTLFVDRSGAIREFIYSYDQDNYVAKNLALLASQIIKKPTDMVIIRSSQIDISKLVYFLNEDGTIAVLNIDNNEKILAWTLWETQGKILEMVGVDQSLFILVERNGQISFEILGKEEYSRQIDYNPENDIYMDSFEVREGRYPNTSCTNTIGGQYGDLWLLNNIWSSTCKMFVDRFQLNDNIITGLERFEGQIVQVLLDEFWQTDGVNNGFLVQNGQIEVQRSYREAKIGLGYIGDIKTLPLSSPNAGTQLNYNRVIKIVGNFYESSGIELDGQYITDRNFDTYKFGQKPELISGIREVYTLGWDRMKQFNLSSKFPYKFHLLSFTTVLDSNGMV